MPWLSKFVCWLVPRTRFHIFPQRSKPVPYCLTKWQSPGLTESSKLKRRLKQAKAKLATSTMIYNIYIYIYKYLYGCYIYIYINIIYNIYNILLKSQFNFECNGMLYVNTVYGVISSSRPMVSHHPKFYSLRLSL